DDVIRMPIPAAAGHVQIRVVEQNPRFRSFGYRRALRGLGLDEVGDRRYPGVRVIVKVAVNAQGSRDSRGADRDVARLIAGIDRWGLRFRLGDGARRDAEREDACRQAYHRGHDLWSSRRAAAIAASSVVMDPSSCCSYTAFSTSPTRGP